MCSTPVLLQGGEVGQQAFMVELLQRQEVQGPLVWKHPQLKATSHGLEQLANEQTGNNESRARNMQMTRVGAKTLLGLFGDF